MYYALEDRKRVIAEKASGKKLMQISEELKMSYSTVKRIWASYKKLGMSGLSLNYNNCGPKQAKYYFIFRTSKWLKRKHPNWGAPFILTILEERYPEEELPCARTLQKWFRVNALIKTTLIREQLQIPKVEAVHDCWQIDAKEKIQLSDNSKACYLTTVDVKSGALLETPLFSLW